MEQKWKVFFKWTKIIFEVDNWKWWTVKQELTKEQILSKCAMMEVIISLWEERNKEILKIVNKNKLKEKQKFEEMTSKMKSKVKNRREIVFDSIADPLNNDNKKVKDIYNKLKNYIDSLIERRDTFTDQLEKENKKLFLYVKKNLNNAVEKYKKVLLATVS